MRVAILVRVSNKARVLVLLRSPESVRGTLAAKAAAQVKEKLTRQAGLRVFPLKVARLSMLYNRRPH
jgi:RecB family endonuclease NucS